MVGPGRLDYSLMARYVFGPTFVAAGLILEGALPRETQAHNATLCWGGVFSTTGFCICLHLTHRTACLSDDHLLAVVRNKHHEQKPTVLGRQSPMIGVSAHLIACLQACMFAPFFCSHLRALRDVEVPQVRAALGELLQVPVPDAAAA